MSVIDRIISSESGGDPNARNPNSSASGLGQFIDATWLSMLAKHRPDIQGSPQELLALKSDPSLSKAMTEAYARDNGAILSESGLPVTPGSTYLAHFAGPKGAVSVLNADPNAPVGQILGEAVVKANPFLANMTAADLRAWADRKMGGQAPQATAQAQAPAPVRPVMQAQAQQPMAGNISMPSQGAEPSTPSLFGQMPVQQIAAAPPPIFAGHRKPIDLSKLRAALEASGNRGLLLSKG
jgi:hypothetical protein